MMDSTRASTMKIVPDVQEARVSILPFDEEIAQIWGKLRVPHAENPLDKQIAATALMYGLTVVTRNVPHYEPTGVAVLNPFT
jgi:predicted nucleic acid-binding protein